MVAFAVQGDVREPQTIENALAKTVEQFGKVDILINNAAGNFMCSAEELSTNGFATVIGIDLQAIYCISHLTPHRARSMLAKPLFLI